MERRSWLEEYKALRDAASDPADLERLATAAYLLGKDAEAVASWTRAHQLFAGRGDRRAAAGCAFWLAFIHLFSGAGAQAGGWAARAERLLDGSPDCVERGYLTALAALRDMFSGDAIAAADGLARAQELGERFGEANLTTLVHLGRAQLLLNGGDPTLSSTLFDEAMVAVTAGETSPLIAGVAYCAVIEACWDAFDVRRAQEWTDALARWCAAQHDLVPYRGQCLVHRAQLLQLRGAWRDAAEETERACCALGDPPQPAIGMALYQRAELHRLAGRYARAEEDYRAANDHGHTPYPGLALLRLAQGRVDAARAAIVQITDESSDPVTRSKVLPACVEILLASSDVRGAREVADELSSIARDFGAPLLDALVAQAEGAVALAEGNPRGAVRVLREAWEGWRQLGAPYEAARVRVLIGRAYRALGNEEGASLEFQAAHRVFAAVGAAADLTMVDALVRRGRPDRLGGLSAREVDVLRLVATGKTNRAIAAELVISEKTIARHVSSIFTKLGVSSRAAATAYAFEHDLMETQTKQ